MSEVRYRRRLGRLRLPDDEQMQFIGALLESHLLLVDQLRMILAHDDLEVSRQAVRLIHVLSISELAPDLIHLFKTVDAFEGRFIKNAILMTLGRLRHDQIPAFLLAVLQDPGDTSYRITAIQVLRYGGNIRPELALPFFHMAENLSEVTEIRCHAIRGLLHHGGGLRVLSLLVPFLEDQSGDVRWTALYAFEKFGNAFFAPVIHPLIHDGHQGHLGDKGDNGTTIGALAQKILAKWALQKE